MDLQTFVCVLGLFDLPDSGFGQDLIADYTADAVDHTVVAAVLAVEVAAVVVDVAIVDVVAEIS